MKKFDIVRLINSIDLYEYEGQFYPSFTLPQGTTGSVFEIHSDHTVTMMSGIMMFRVFIHDVEVIYEY